MSALEASVTLEDVFAVAVAKRVPLAPELAGYLTLEIADGARAAGGEIDPRAVYISDEGTVALVHARKDPPMGDVETSLRAILAKLLEASGSATPALSAAARKPAGEGLAALAIELEAALIPVNRAAGRRALARLARAVKRVTLGVGRNASLPSVRGSSPSFTDEAATAKRDLPALAAETAAPESTSVPRSTNLGQPPPSTSSVAQAERIRARGMVRGPELRKRAPQAAPADTRAIETRDPEPPASTDKPRSPSKLFAGDEVESLVDAFGVSSLGDSKQLSRDLKAIADLEPTPPPPSAAALDAMLDDFAKEQPRAVPANHDEPDGVEALLALADASAPLPQPAPPPSQASQASQASRPSSAKLSTTEPGPNATAQHREEPPAPRTRRTLPSTRGLLSAEPPPRPRTRWPLLVGLALVVAAAGAAVWTFRARMIGRASNTVRPAASVTAAPPVDSAAAAAARCKAVLVVRDAPKNAEILLRVGQAPLEVERMPVGTRLEFVATAEGYAPRRAVVAADATWERGPNGKPRLDVPIQLDPSHAKPGAVDKWPSAEAGSEVGGGGAPGTVHIVSNVRGAEVWLLAGLGPETRIEALRCDGDIDVLLAGPPTLRRHLHVNDDDVASAQIDSKGNKVITISAK